MRLTLNSRFTLLVVPFLLATSLSGVGCDASEDQKEALLDQDLETIEDVELSFDAPDTSQDPSRPPAAENWASYSLVSSVSVSGSTVEVPAQNPNDASWILNSPNVSGQLSVLSATLVHDGFFNGPNGLGHLAVLSRGTTVDSSLQLMGFLPSASSGFWWGEQLASAGMLGGQLGPQLSAIIRGRGPSFWPAGQGGMCSANPQQPCLVFENYSMHQLGGAVLVGPAIPLSLTQQPFQITVETDRYDIQVWVWQGGQLKQYASCLQVAGGDQRCGAQPGDGAVGDAAFAFVMQGPLPNFAGRRLGVLDSTAEVWRQQVGGGCDDCIEP